jgi:hypothetical protein
MSAAFGGSSQSHHATGAYTSNPNLFKGTPFATMVGPQMQGINALLSGSAVQGPASAVTKASNMNLQTGIQNLKSTFAGTGMGQSTDLARGINQMTQQSGINLAATIGPMVLQSLQAGIQDVFGMASGTQNNWGSQFGWGAGVSVTGSYPSLGGTTGFGPPSGVSA